jgi:hypothetical protein
MQQIHSGANFVDRIHGGSKRKKQTHPTPLPTPRRTFTQNSAKENKKDTNHHPALQTEGIKAFHNL